MKRKAEEIDLDSLIEKMELMNCFNSYEELELLKESYKLKYKIKNLEIKEIKNIITKTYFRYKRYLENIDMDGLNQIKNNIIKFTKIHETKEIDEFSWYIKIKNLILIMIETDELILSELNYNKEKYNKIEV